jgi:hypothetical protein
MEKEFRDAISMVNLHSSALRGSCWVTLFEKRGCVFPRLAEEEEKAFKSFKMRNFYEDTKVKIVVGERANQCFSLFLHK